MLTTEQINNLIGVEESYQASFKLQELLDDKSQRNQIFASFLELESDLSFDWFTDYFQEEHSDRKGKKQDFTPNGVTTLASELLGDFNSNADICAGTGGLTIKRWTQNKTGSFYCEEFSDRAMPFLLFNLAIRNVNAVIVHGDSLTRKHKHIYKLDRSKQFSEITEVDTVPQVKSDTVIMNPPYSLAWDPAKSDVSGLLAEIGTLPPKSKADYAFLIRGLERLSDDGTQALILPHGVLFRGSAEGKIRRWIIEHDYLDAVIGLPEKVFLNTDIPTVILILKKNRQNKDVLFIDASKQFEKDKSHNVVKTEHVNKIIDVYKKRTKIDKFSNVVNFDYIQENDFNLNIPRYVDTFEPDPVVPLDDILNDLKDIDREIEKEGQALAGMMLELRSNNEQTNAEMKRFARYWAKRYGLIVNDAKEDVTATTKMNEGEQLSLL